ncbi:MAG TPA: lysozyme [Ramlibacter sp.]|nr:lysozyme [Ramlibacter sp.]
MELSRYRRPFASLRRQLGQASNVFRVAVASLAITGAGLVAILNREDYRGQAYPDPVHGTKVPTIGFGSTEGVKMGDTITPVKAINRTLREIRTKENAIKRCVHAPLASYEYDAFVRLAHNIGEGRFCSSTAVRKVNALDYRGACDAILLFNRSGNQICSEPGNRVCSGLWKDRLETHKQCLGEGAS